jgi:hypothetical protein
VSGWPSKKAGVYICTPCGLFEYKKASPPLQEWAVFKKENAHVFFTEENGKH